MWTRPGIRRPLPWTPAELKYQQEKAWRGGTSLAKPIFLFPQFASALLSFHNRWDRSVLHTTENNLRVVVKASSLVCPYPAVTVSEVYGQNFDECHFDERE